MNWEMNWDKDILRNKERKIEDESLKEVYVPRKKNTYRERSLCTEKEMYVSRKVRKKMNRWKKFMYRERNLRTEKEIYVPRKKFM